jgi:diguanylate cyclase (GGDEF)-like protein/PAS domain S-box-containing protein
VPRDARPFGAQPGLALRALDVVASAVAVVDSRRRDYPLVHANEAFARLTGSTPEELIGRPAAVLRAEGADGATRVDLLAALDAGAPWTGTLRCTRADGSTFVGELTVTPLHDAAGLRSHVVAVLRDASHELDIADELLATRSRYGRVIDDLAAAELRYRELVERIPAVVYLADFDDEFTLRYISPQVRELLGRAPEAFVADGSLWYRHVHPDDVARVRESDLGARTRRSPQALEYRMVADDGRVLWVSDRDEVVRDETGRPLFSQGVVVDITAQRRAEEELREERDRAQSYLDLAGMVVAVIEPDGRVALLNRAGHQLLGHPDGTLVGRDWFDLCVPENHRERRRAEHQALLGDDREAQAALADDEDGVPLVTAAGEERVLRWNHTVLRDEEGHATALLGSGVDITEHLRAERQIAHLAYHDPLTGLPNRALLREHLDLALARARRNAGAVALLYLDLDDFKLVNDSLGHGAGDELLCRVALELRDRVRATDLIVRQGGDEFLLLLADLDAGSAQRDAQAAAVAVRGALADPFRIAGAEFHVGASIGISLFPRDALDAEALLKHADTAMYQAKAAGRSEVVVYHDDPRQPIERLSLSTRLRRAISSDELVLHWQPIVDLAGGTVSAVEALVRWRDPDRGLLLPGDFVPFAEETGLIGRLGSWVAEAVAAQRLAWREAGHDPRVHLNVSPRQLAQRGFVADLVGRLTPRGLDLRNVTIEITESLAMRDDGRAVPLLRELRETGLRLAIDDFGAGWSSLSRLRDLPVQVVKIDRSFLVDVPGSAEGGAIVAAMLSLIEALDMQAVAEGVENEHQREFLRRLGCPAAQGYLLGRPMPVDELDELLPGALASRDPARHRTGRPAA